MPPFGDGEEVHPGWMRATAILLRGMERLRTQEREAARTAIEYEEDIRREDSPHTIAPAPGVIRRGG